MIKKIKYYLALSVLCGLVLTGCTTGDSGLYRVKAREEMDIYEETEVPVSSDPIPEPQEEAPLETEAAGEDEEAVLYVHVCGAVNAPGVYEFMSGDRVFNAVEAAGGFNADADKEYINLAQALSDGMKITIPTVEEVENGAESLHNSMMLEGSSLPSPTDIADNSGKTQSGKVDINAASDSELTSIPGIGQTKASAITAYREQHGAFKSIEDIKNVSGIGDATFERIKDYITIGR